MLRSSEYFSFNSSWISDTDPGFLSNCVLYETEDEWNINDEPEVKIGTEFLTFTRGQGDMGHLEIQCWCTPHLNCSVFGVDIVSEARNLECYSETDGYLKSCQGRKLETADINDETRGTTLYRCRFKLDDVVNDLTLKFIGSADKSDICIRMLDYKLLQGTATSGVTGMVDMSKVRGYLHSMGDNLPAHAAEMMDSVEQFQQTQMANMNQLTSALGNSVLSSPGSSSVLSNLLSMVTARSCDNGVTNQNSAMQTHPNNSIPNSDSFTNSNTERTNSESSPSPLQAMLRQMSQGQGRSFEDDTGQDDSGMFQMLQNICGKVSELRVKEHEAQKTKDMEEESSENKTSQQKENNTENNENKMGQGQINFEELQTSLEQTVSQLILSSEQRLKEYVDTSLSALENRLCAKMEDMLTRLQENGHSKT